MSQAAPAWPQHPAVGLAACTGLPPRAEMRHRGLRAGVQPSRVHSVFCRARQVARCADSTIHTVSRVHAVITHYVAPCSFHLPWNC